jgi:hypothetical protein
LPAKQLTNALGAFGYTPEEGALTLNFIAYAALTAGTVVSIQDTAGQYVTTCPVNGYPVGIVYNSPAANAVANVVVKGNYPAVAVGATTGTTALTMCGVTNTAGKVGGAQTTIGQNVGIALQTASANGTCNVFVSPA